MKDETQNNQIYIPDEENPYLYDMSGPKSKDILDTNIKGVREGDDMDMENYDADLQNAFGVLADGSYKTSIKHSNEKFSLNVKSTNGGA